jgi:hypothetical protein
MAPKGDAIHVVLPQPQHLPGPASRGASHDMTHRSTLCSRKGDAAWSARQIPADRTLTFGFRNEPVTVPGEDEMSNVSKMPGGKSVKVSDLEPDGAVKGAHLILLGGALTIRSPIGAWLVEDAQGTEQEVYFPYRMAWTGPVDLDQPQGEIQIWNATEKESPTLGDHCTFPKPEDLPDEEEAARMAAEHFKAYYYILTKTPGPKIKYKGKKNSLVGPPIPAKVATLVLSSCPSAQARLT